MRPEPLSWVNGVRLSLIKCISEKNYTLICYDILQSMRNMYEVANDEGIRDKALQLIETEDNLKYRKKYTGLWRAR